MARVTASPASAPPLPHPERPNCQLVANSPFASNRCSLQGTRSWSCHGTAPALGLGSKVHSIVHCSIRHETKYNGPQLISVLKERLCSRRANYFSILFSLRPDSWLGGDDSHCQVPLLVFSTLNQKYRMSLGNY